MTIVEVETVRRTGRNLPEVLSGALHDTVKMAQHMPAGMLFVASRDGISHDPRVFSGKRLGDGAPVGVIKSVTPTGFLPIKVGAHLSSQFTSITSAE